MKNFNNIFIEIFKGIPLGPPRILIGIVIVAVIMAISIGIPLSSEFSALYIAEQSAITDGVLYSALEIDLALARQDLVLAEEYIEELTEVIRVQEDELHHLTTILAAIVRDYQIDIANEYPILSMDLPMFE